MSRKAKKFPLAGYAINEIPVNGRAECFEIVDQKFATKVKMKVSMVGEEKCEDGEVRYYFWDFGDEYSTKDNPNFYVTTDPTEEVEHEYNYNGKYTIHFIEVSPETGKIVERTFPIVIENGVVRGLAPKITDFKITKIDEEGHFSISFQYENPGEEIIDIIVRVFNDKWELIHEQSNNLDLLLDDGTYWIELGIENEYCLWDYQVKSLKVDLFRFLGYEWEKDDDCLFVPNKPYILKILATKVPEDLSVSFNNENVYVERIGDLRFKIVFPEIDEYMVPYNFTVVARGKKMFGHVDVYNIHGGLILTDSGIVKMKETLTGGLILSDYAYMRKKGIMGGFAIGNYIVARG